MSKSQDNRIMINNLMQSNSMEESNLQPVNMQFAVSKLVTTSTFYKEKKSVLKSTRGFHEDQPLSINSGVKYEPYEFEKNLKKNYGSKLEEDLYKIKQYTNEMQRTEQESKMKEKNHIRMRQQDMNNYEKKIPKLAILHKIQAFHRRKFPQFDINKCLMRRKQYPDDVSREEIIVIEEKKISKQVGRKTLLQRQQDIIKRCLSPNMRDKLGMEVESRQGYNNQGDETNQNQNETQTPFGFGSHTPSNRHHTPCCFSFHDDNAQKQLMNKSFNTKRASTSSDNRRYHMLNQSLDSNIQSYGINQQDKQNIKIFQKRGSLVNPGSYNNQDTANTSIQYQSNPYESTIVSQNNQFQNQRKVSTAISTPKNDSPEREQQAIELSRKKRQNSPMRFLFKKYENVIDQSYDDFRIEMKTVADIYYTNNKRKNQNPQQQETMNTDSTQNRRANETESSNQNENFGKRQSILYTASNQRKNSLSITQNNQHRGNQNFQSLNVSQNTSPIRQQGIPEESEDGYYQPKSKATRGYYQPPQSAQPSSRGKSQGQSKFLNQNDSINSKNQELNKTLNDFEKQSKQIKKIANNIQKFSTKSDKQIDNAFEMRKNGDSYNVSDFLMKVRQKKTQEQEDQQKDEALRKKFGKVQRTIPTQGGGAAAAGNRS